MQRGQFHYHLPSELIAQVPTEDRGGARMLCLDGESGVVEDRFFRALPSLLHAGDLLVFNDTRVIPARLYGRKASGGRVELLVERVLDDRRALVHLRASKSPAAGSALSLDDGVTARVEGRQQDLFVVRFEGSESVFEILDRIGHIPLPPYIQRADTDQDRERYQTIYARNPGAVAAPTAGLHFDQVLLERMAGLGVESAFLTLHVGAGTFQPVRTDDIGQHHMHSEFTEVSAELCQQVARAQERGGRVIAVGTTVVRALETASRSGRLSPFCGDTDIFIYPGFEFRTVDTLITNFHLPESTLLMLVCAFAGYDPVMRAYRHAVQQRYRFFSYGDAMFISRRVSDA